MEEWLIPGGHSSAEDKSVLAEGGVWYYDYISLSHDCFKFCS